MPLSRYRKGVEHDRCNGSKRNGRRQNQKYDDLGNADTAQHLQPPKNALILVPKSGEKGIRILFGGA